MPKKKAMGSLSALLWVSLVACAASVAVVPFGFVDEPVIEDLPISTDFVFLPGSGQRMLVLEKIGRIRLVIDGRIQSGTVLNFEDRVHSYLDRGALGIAVDTDYSSGTRYIYVSHAYETNNPVSAPRTGQVFRFEMNAAGTSAVAGSETVILGSVTGPGCDGLDLNDDVICCDSHTHCVGALEMDSGGNLFVSLGEGAFPSEPDDKGMRSQEINFLPGKVLRVNRDGKGVEGNPFFTAPYTEDDNAAKVWWLGGRNPWRIDIDPYLGVPWVAEVGWATFEEFNLAEEGGNGGWPCEHGDRPIPAWSEYDQCKNFPVYGDVVPPRYFYPRDDGTAASGALRVPFDSWPASYRDHIFVSDYTGGWLKHFEVDAQGNRVGGVETFATGYEGVVRTRRGPGDSLYYMSIIRGDIRRISYDPDTSAPEVSTVLPPDGSSNAETTLKVVIQFSKQIDPDTIAASIALVNDETSARVGGRATYNDATYVAVFTPSSELDATTTYRLEISTGIADPAGRNMAALFEVTFSTGTGRSAYLSDLPFESSYNQVGPVERDQSNGWTDSDDGTTITLRGREFEKGIGMAADAEVVIEVPDGCTRLRAEVGIDDIVGNLDAGSVIVKVLVDGDEAFSSGSTPIGRSTPPMDVDVEVEGASEVALRADRVDRRGQRANQRVSWADARFRCGAFDGEGPEVTSVEPTDGSTGVMIESPTIAVSFSEPMDEASCLAHVRLRDSSDAEVGWRPVFSDSLRNLRLATDTLAYDTEYTLIIGGEVRDLAGNSLGSDVVTEFRTAGAPATGSVVYLNNLTPTLTKGIVDTDVSPVAMMDGTGGGGGGGGGDTFEYQRGIGVLADSGSIRVHYSVPAGCTAIEGFVGVAPKTGGAGSCVFKVKTPRDGGGGFNIAFSRQVFGGEAPAPFSVPVIAGQQVRLFVFPRGDEPENNICNWSDVQLVCGGGTVPVTDLDPAAIKGSVSFDEDVEGDPIQLGAPGSGGGAGGGVVNFDSGFIMEPGDFVARLGYDVPGSCSRFLADVGLPVGTGSQATPQFLVRTAEHGDCRQNVRFGDAPKSVSCNIEGSSEIQLLARDVDGNIADDICAVGEPRFDCAVGTRQPSCVIEPLPTDFVIGDTITFTGTAYDFQGNELPASTISWRVIQNHCPPCHIHNVFQTSGVTSDSFTVDDHGDTFFYTVECEVCDGPDCACSSANAYGQLMEVTVNSEPAGLTVGVDSAIGPAPLTTTVVVGSTVALSTVRSQGDYEFVDWAHDGGAGPTTSVTITDTRPRTFTVNFEI